MSGDGGPIIRSSPTKIVSSIIGCESTKAHERETTHKYNAFLRFVVVIASYRRVSLKAEAQTTYL